MSFVEIKFTTAMTVHKNRQDLTMITTGSKDLDNLLGGGVETGTITEIFGELRTGKTQLCHMLAVTAQLPLSMNGGEGKCLFIDTENTFRSNRILSISDRFSLDGDKTLDNISYAHAYNTDHQSSLLLQAAAIMSETRFSMLIVDSAINHFPKEFTGHGELATRQMNLSQFLRQLQALADVYGIAVVITNQMVAQVDGASLFISDPKKATGGHTIAHNSCTRLYLKKGQGDNRICKIYSSPCLPESDCTFTLSENGIRDSA
jgi:DNA repair protein RAD51